jgi:hypothetical protein
VKGVVKKMKKKDFGLFCRRTANFFRGIYIEETVG